MSLKSLFVDNVHTTLFTLLSHIMNRSFQPAMTAVLLSAALVLLAALPSSAGIGDGRHLVRNLSNNAATNSYPQIDGSNVVWRGNADGNNDIYLVIKLAATTRVFPKNVVEFLKVCSNILVVPVVGLVPH